MLVHDGYPTRRKILSALGLGAVGLSISSPRAAFAETGVLRSFTWKNGRLVMPDGQVIEGGIRIEEGRIAELGPSVKSGADLGGSWVCPGFVDAGCTVGLVEIGLEDRTRDDRVSGESVTPDARVRDGYNPASSVIPVTRVEGVGHVLVHPSHGRLVSGQASLFRTVGETLSEAITEVPSVLCINMGRAGIGGDGAASRMDLSMQLRELLDDIDLGPEPSPNPRTRRRKTGAEDSSHDDLSASERVWRSVRRGEMRVLIKAERADDILRALDLSHEYGLSTILLGAAEGHVVARELADSEIPVFLGPLTTQPSSFEHLRARYENAAILNRAGVPLAFRTGSAHSSRGLRVSAGVAVAHGLPWEAAMKALCHGAWAALGQPNEGVLEVGAEAHLVVSSGDPIQPRQSVERVVISGVETSMMTRQRRLYEHFRVLDERIR
jgi:imidazolonepropionase-like amidohydrolase